MPLKRYQERVLAETRLFLERVAKEQAAKNKHASMDAWDETMKILGRADSYHARKNGLGKDLPNICIKVPTGGGKTLLAAHSLGLMYQTILKDRNGAGLVLWVVPSDQIYKDTLRQLRDRRHFIRESLEHSISRRIEVWEKGDIFRLTPAQLRTNLNVLVLILASTNRETKDQLKFFRDSGGNIVRHFPPEDAPKKHKEMKDRVSNLEMLTEDDKKGEYLAKTSLANLVRLCEPPIILDEGHKATSELARKTIADFNASIVVELSATPPGEANKLSRVKGTELLDEHMIKLPINVSNSDQKAWKDCLTSARDKRDHLARLATKYYKESGRLIRPIVLVQVERTGKDQREAGFVHSEAVKEYLIQRLGVSPEAIAIKTSEKDDIEGIDLLEDGCPIEWIITKAALQEGWDCQFAYVLVSLSNTGSQQSMTQLVGRVLRQPYVERTVFDDLNQSYVFCLRRKAAEIAKDVKKALENEGYEGDAASVVDRSEEAGKPSPKKEAKIREEFRRYYRKYDGKIYLPRFCVKTGGEYEGLDYYRHLVSKIGVDAFDFKAVSWDMAEDAKAAKDALYRITLGQEELEKISDRPAEVLEDDEKVKEWIVATLQVEHFGYRQLRQFTERAAEGVLTANPDLAGKLALVKFPLRDKLAALIEQETDRLTEAVFDELYEKKRLCFYLECVEARFEIPSRIELQASKRLVHNDGEQIQQSLFDFVADDMNEYEKAIALYLDSHPEVLWWYRNLVGSQNFAIQGFRRNRVYPDFVVQEGSGAKKKPKASVLVVESKGKHLKGSEDTKYKRKVADYFTKVGHRVPWQKLAEDFSNCRFRFQVLDEDEYGGGEWKAELRRLLA